MMKKQRLKCRDSQSWYVVPSLLTNSNTGSRQTFSFVDGWSTLSLPKVHVIFLVTLDNPSKYLRYCTRGATWYAQCNLWPSVTTKRDHFCATRAFGTPFGNGFCYLINRPDVVILADLLPFFFHCCVTNNKIIKEAAAVVQQHSKLAYCAEKRDMASVFSILERYE